jgi:hypothetical protein
MQPLFFKRLPHVTGIKSSGSAFFKLIFIIFVITTKQFSMQSLKKYGLLVAILITVNAAMAQQELGKKTPDERANHQAAWCQKHLGVDDIQQKKIYGIYVRHAMEMDNARNNHAGKQRVREIQSSTDAAMKEVLTPGQFSQYIAHQQEMHEMREERRMNSEK